MTTGKKIGLGTLLATLVLGICLGVWLTGKANGPDRDLVFVREVPAATDHATLSKALEWATSWHQWHDRATEAELKDLRGATYPAADQRAMSGALVQYTVMPKRDPLEKFRINAEILEFTPGKVLHVRVISDSKDKIMRLFDRLEWRIELIQGPPPGAPGAQKEFRGDGTRIKGTVFARTHHWRSRLLSAIDERILMSQVFHPNLERLAELKQPTTPADAPAYQH